MSQIEESICDLLHWARINSANSTLHPDVEIYNDPITGLSFRAMNNILPTTIVSCPYSISLSCLNTVEGASCFPRHESLRFPQGFLSLLQDEPHVIGHFFLMQQYQLGEDSFWWPYIRLLPQPYEPDRLGIPIWWPEEDQKFLAGTNAEPPLEKRKKLWIGEYERGISALRGAELETQAVKDFTYNLYQWAATIFGTRSFRASLTIPKSSMFDENVWSHVVNDRFSILLPVVDIGNHNGVNNMEWHRDSTSFSLSNRTLVREGSQIYNFYGKKSNSELLVGYGFMLEDIQKDTVNLKLKPSSEAQALRRAQACYSSHSADREINDDEFMFYVRNVPGTYKETQLGAIKATPFQLFSEGLIDTIACMLANERERHFIFHHPEYCLEKDSAMFNGGPMSRLAVHIFSVLSGKLEHEETRITELGAALEAPVNTNQHLALSYRNRQLSVLQNALRIIKYHLNSLTPSPTSNVPHMISLPQAYAVLANCYPSISQEVEALISQDQDEPLPLNWLILVSEGWDFAYWTVWFYVVSLLRIRDGQTFGGTHKALGLGKWLREMDMESGNHIMKSPLILSWSPLQTPDISTYAEDPEETETIAFMINAINKLPEFDTPGIRDIFHNEEKMRSIRATAARIGREETLSLPGADVGKVVWIW